MRYSIEIYETIKGKTPYAEWLESLDENTFSVILILNGGTKRTQPKDIKKAKEYLEDYKMRGKHAKK